MLEGRGLLAMAIGCVLVVAANLLLLLPFDTLEELVAEDGVVEWVGALGLFAASGLFLACFVVVHRRGAEASGLSGLGKWVLLLLAILMFAAAGEEISWGQRIFGWATPESINAVNEQGETNLHNLTPFEGSSLLSSSYAFTAFWFGLFVGIPVLALIRPARAWLRRTVPIVPWSLTVLFLFAVAFQQLDDPLFGSRFDVDRVGSVFDHSILLGHAAQEIWEGIVEVLTGVAAYIALRQLLERPAAETTARRGGPATVSAAAQ